MVETHRIEQFASELGIPFLETSAKLNSNVIEAFQTIADRFVQHRQQEESNGKYIGNGKKELLNGMNVDREDGSDVSAWKRCLGSCTIQ